MIPDLGCPPDPVCCDSIYSKAAEILAVAKGALCDCCGPERCSSFAEFVGIGSEPQMGAIDYIAVWFTRVLPAPPSAKAQGTQHLPRFRFSYSVKLHETGYPLLDAQARPPEPEAVNHAARVGLSHVEVVLRRLLHSMRQFSLTKAGSYQAFDSVTARPRTAAGIAHIIELTLEHDWLPAVEAP